MTHLLSELSSADIIRLHTQGLIRSDGAHAIATSWLPVRVRMHNPDFDAFA